MLTLNIKSIYIKGKSLTLNVKKYIKGNFYIKGCNSSALSDIFLADYAWNWLTRNHMTEQEVCIFILLKH